MSKKSSNITNKKKRRIRWERVCALLLGAVLIVVGAFQIPKGIRMLAGKNQSEDASSRQTNTETLSAAHTETEKNSATITITGDILLEEAILNYFGDGDWGTYMEALHPYFLNDDLTIANLEVPIGGEELGITGINFSFNAPAITAQNIRNNGIDAVSLANNHAMDRGTEGIANTHKNLDAQGIEYTGTATSQEERDSVKILEVNGIKIGFVSWTYNTNQPIENTYDANIFYGAWYDQVNTLLADVEAAKEASDVVFVAMHWGTEFTYDLNEDQLLIGQQLADAGVDVIIGNHPHTIQPAAWLTGSDGNQTLCFYSLGNLVSSAYTVSRADEQFQNMYEVGAIAQFDLVKDSSSGEVTVQEPKIIPVVNHFQDEYQDFMLLPLKDYTEEMAARHDQRNYSENFTVSWLKDQVSSVFEDSGILLDIGYNE